MDAAGIGAGDDDEIAVGAGGAGGADFRGHRLGLDQPLAREVPAALGQHLVLQVNARNAGALEEAHAALDVERLAEAGVGVAQERQRGGEGDGAGELDEVVEGEQSHVGHAGRRGQGTAGEVDRAEAEALGHLRHQGIEDAGDGDGLRLPGIAQAAAGGGLRGHAAVVWAGAAGRNGAAADPFW